MTENYTERHCQHCETWTLAGTWTADQCPNCAATNDLELRDVTAPAFMIRCINCSNGQQCTLPHAHAGDHQY